MNKPKYIKNWKELSEVTSETHILEVDIEGGNGWIEPKSPNKDNPREGRHYLSTHTFYGGTHEYSTKVLQSCGFNVVLANWDKEKSCCDCRFFDGVCCMFKCRVLAILDTAESANECEHHDIGDYNQIELEKTNYQ